ncbi:trimeric intracellular cation channel family protein, partial [Corynebacterium sp.]|uniref:trimeric intracellular cation channel family protein n=1 Tax=Corynebacterium sp. TaxID=1720 RepID=UPI002A90A85A
MSSLDTAALVTVLYLIGITAEAMTAAVSAGRLRMDLFGVVTLGALTALGGGTVRDVLLGSYPLTWVEEPRYLLVVIVASVVTVRISWLMHHGRRLFLFADAIGLATFVVMGIQTALAEGHGFIIACVAAVTTGVSGGVMRDVLSGRVPLVFRKEMYASTAVIGTCVWWVLLYFSVPEWIIV